MDKNVIARTLLVLLALLVPAACRNALDDDGADHIEPEDLRDNVAFQGVFDCTERDDNGYRQGSRFDISVVQVDARPVEVRTANAYIAMQAAAHNAGVTVRVVSGFRTQSQQQYLYGCYTNCDCNNCNLAARPGFSNHQSGHALDLNASDDGVGSWLNSHADEFGFARTVSGEPWHWEWWGSASDYSGPCGVSGGTVDADTLPSDCAPIVGTGGSVNDGDACFVPGGPSATLRAVDGGEGNAQVWTYATANNNPANFAVWWLPVSQAGRYRIEASADSSLATSRQTKYRITHGSGESQVVVDQRGHSGFFSLGEFTLSSSSPGRVRVNDNTGEAGSLQRRIVFDAIRIVRIDGQTVDACPRVLIDTASGSAVNVRPSASTGGAAIGTIADGTTVTRLATSNGQSVDGVSEWFRVETSSAASSVRGWVTARYATCLP